jgi:hypothetical protein
MSDWSAEETDDPIHADRRNLYKVEKWSRHGQRITQLLFAGSSLDKARAIFTDFARKRHERSWRSAANAVLQRWPE